ncbi:hypothetical protein OOT46_27005 [Aquabacterium sp. A7-Y]|uniref:hypothetical protein n=1 Tax=Aquabacterium sp. A7-Y TaxID=1349605 RepID=UPI00223DD6F4|nr:hypothetical protein [Aquabacterium sp. A7-Y]MCW7541463.1 hypothetical protein [Aquabacterium sp. A7-Y]
MNHAKTSARRARPHHILQLLKAANRRRGVSANEAASITGRTPTECRSTLRKLAQQGELIQVAAAYRVTRWFAKQEHGEAWMLGYSKPTAAKPARLPSVLPAHLPVVVPHGLQVQICPSPAYEQPAPGRPIPMRAGAFDFRKYQRAGRY